LSRAVENNDVLKAGATLVEETTAVCDAKALGAKAAAVRKLEASHMVDRAALATENFIVMLQYYSTYCTWQVIVRGARGGEGK
jgi:hypothetical protein